MLANYELNIYGCYTKNMSSEVYSRLMMYIV